MALSALKISKSVKEASSDNEKAILNVVHARSMLIRTNVYYENFSYADFFLI